MLVCEVKSGWKAGLGGLAGSIFLAIPVSFFTREFLDESTLPISISNPLLFVWTLVVLGPLLLSLPAATKSVTIYFDSDTVSIEEKSIFGRKLISCPSTSKALWKLHISVSGPSYLSLFGDWSGTIGKGLLQKDLTMIDQTLSDNLPIKSPSETLL